MPFFVLAGVSAVSNIAGAAISASAAESAANTQSAAAQQAEQRLQQNYQTTLNMEQPYAQAGTGALQQLEQGLGLIPGQNGPMPNGFLSTPATQQNFQASPGYQFEVQQGEQALLDQQSATGGVAGGNTLKALMGYGEGMASTQYQQFINNIMNEQNQQYGNLAGLINVGQGAVTTDANAGQGTATNVANLITGSGANQAAAQVAGANGLSGALSSSANSLTSNYLLSQLIGGGGGGGLPSINTTGPLDLNALANPVSAMPAGYPGYG